MTPLDLAMITNLTGFIGGYSACYLTGRLRMRKLVHGTLDRVAAMRCYHTHQLGQCSLQAGHDGLHQIANGPHFGYAMRPWDELQP